MHEVITSFKNALDGLEEVLEMEYTEVVRDASIQRFEFTTELAWKSIQKFLKVQNITCNSPKSCLQEAFKFGLVEDDPIWIRMMDDRNLTVHTYDEDTAYEIFTRLSSYTALLKNLLKAIEKAL